MDEPPAESPSLRLAIAKAERGLGWHPQWDLERACEKTVAWYRARRDGKADLAALCRGQIAEYRAALPVAA
jgi:CDP-glucose 4,6-dehydratase